MKTTIFIALTILIISCSKDDTLNGNGSSTIEINYFDWNPDTLVIDSILIDLQSDGINDIKFLIEKDYQGFSPSGGPYYNYFARCLSINPNLRVSLGTELNPSQQDWNCLKFNDLISNNLTSLNLKNGNNENITGMISVLNPNLFCIDVDDPSQAPYPGWGVDSQTIFSEDCSLNLIDNMR